MRSINTTCEYFTEKELADLKLAVATINAWNRLAISAMTVAGQYRAKPKGSTTYDKGS